MDSCLHVSLSLNSNPLILQERLEIQQPSKSLIVRLLARSVSWVRTAWSFRFYEIQSYARVRHPIYSGLLLAMIGTALYSGEWRAAPGVLVIFVAHQFKARREEALLAGQFGATYEEYRQRMGSLLPRLE
jgi:protein-S-isoprenylcysteine O-methyltransferase Ste14